MHQTVTEGRRRQAGLLSAMDREWRMIVAGGAGRRAWRRWAPELRAGGIDVDGADDLVEIIRHPGDHARSDAVARVLLAAAQAGDELAARALMQGLVPFVGRLAGLYARYGSAPIDDAVAEVLAAVQLRIMRTRLDERDHLLVAYLQLTVRRQLGRAGSRRILRATPETPLEVLDGLPDGDGVRFAETVLHSTGRRCAAEHVAVIVTSGVRAGALTLDDAELLLLTAAGNTAATIARQLQRDPSVICRRLQRATRAAARIAA